MPRLLALCPSPDLSNPHTGCRVPRALSSNQLPFQANLPNSPHRPTLRAKRKESFQTSQGKEAEETQLSVDSVDEQMELLRLKHVASSQSFQFCCFQYSFVSNSLGPYSLPWNSPGKNTRVGSHLLLQGIFPTQRSNQVSCVVKQILYH